MPRKPAAAPSLSDQLSAMKHQPGANPASRIHHRVAELLGLAIVSGRHAPGSTLKNEIEASEALGVSRPVYREAVRMLAAKGLVQSRTKTGTQVTPRRRWHLLDPDILAWIFQSGPDPEFVRQLFELREVIEPAASALAAQRRDAVQLARLGHALEEMARWGLDTPQGRQADEAFHAEILLASDNEPMMALVDSIAASVRWTTTLTYRDANHLRDPIPGHRRLYEAIAERDTDAARAASLELVRQAHEDTRVSMSGRAADARGAEAVAPN